MELRDCIVDDPKSQACVLVGNDAACTNIRFVGGHYRNAKQHGIQIGATNAVTGFEVSNALIEGAAGNGLTILNGFDGIVSNNRITGCTTGWGIEEITPSDRNLFTGNLLKGNGAGIKYYAAGTSEAIRNVAPSLTVEDSGGFRQTIDGFTFNNIGQNQAAVEMARANGRFRAVRDGSITGILVTNTVAGGGGTLTVTVYKKTGVAGGFGAATLSSTTLTGTQFRNTATQLKDAVPFAAGDELYMVIQTVGWTAGGSPIAAFQFEN